MNTIILILLSLSLISSVLIIYLNFKSKSDSSHEKENQEIERLNQEIINLKESLTYKILQDQAFIREYYFQMQIITFGHHQKPLYQKVSQKKNLIKNLY